MKRFNENSNDDVNSNHKKNKFDINIEDNILIVNQKELFKSKDDEMRNASDIIINAFNNGITKVLFHLESGAFANHELFSEKTLDILMDQEKKRIIRKLFLTLPIVYHSSLLVISFLIANTMAFDAYEQ